MINWLLFIGFGVVFWVAAVLIKPRLELPGLPCHHCGYDLAGLDVEQRCPECGNAYLVRQAQPLASRLGHMLAGVGIATAGLGLAIGFSLGLSGALLPALLVALLATLLAAGVPTVVMSSGARRPVAWALCYGALTPGALTTYFFCVSDTFWRLGYEDSSFAVVPLIGAAGAGYGVFAAVFACNRLGAW